MRTTRRSTQEIVQETVQREWNHMAKAMNEDYITLDSDPTKKAKQIADYKGHLVDVILDFSTLSLVGLNDVDDENVRIAVLPHRDSKGILFSVPLTSVVRIRGVDLS